MLLVSDHRGTGLFHRSQHFVDQRGRKAGNCLLQRLHFRQREQEGKRGPGPDYSWE